MFKIDGLALRGAFGFRITGLVCRLCGQSMACREQAHAALRGRARFPGDSPRAGLQVELAE